MSAPGLESVPTSADPRSRRPTKKRALTPVSAQAASVDALFARPDQEIRITNASASSSGNKRGGGGNRMFPAPPEIVSNVQGSSAGAGSGEFHVYKAARRREAARMRAMDEEREAEEAADDFESLRRKREAEDAERTRRRREKRDKKKNKKAKADKWKPMAPRAAGTEEKEDEGEGQEGGNDKTEAPAVTTATAMATGEVTMDGAATTRERGADGGDGERRGNGPNKDTGSTSAGSGGGQRTATTTSARSGQQALANGQSTAAPDPESGLLILDDD